MASALKNLSFYDENSFSDGKELNIAIAVADWNEHITHALYEGCFDTLIKHGVTDDNIKTVQVPGTFELPVAARILLSSKPYDAVICIGCVIKGETKHDEYINNAVAQGLVQLSILTSKPVIFSVLTTNDEQQALDRAGGKHGNKGVEAAITALRMATLQKSMKNIKPSIGFGNMV